MKKFKKDYISLTSTVVEVEAVMKGIKATKQETDVAEEIINRISNGKKVETINKSKNKLAKDIQEILETLN